MEVAWQAYYDPHKVNLSDFIAPGRQDLSYLGLELVVRLECSRQGLAGATVYRLRESILISTIVWIMPLLVGLLRGVLNSV